MPWNYLMIDAQTVPATPTFGEGDLSLEQARAAVRKVLGRAVADHPDVFKDAAQAWHRGDSVVSAGPFTWAVYEYGGDPMAGAMAWLDQYSRRMTGSGARWAASSASTTVDPAAVIRTAVLGVMPGRTYHSALPPELEPWYCYTLDGGHSIAVVVLDDDDEQNQDLAEHIVPAPVKTVLRLGWRMQDGYVVCDVPYDPARGIVVPPEDDEYDEQQPAPEPAELTLLEVGQPYHQGRSQWPEQAELVLRPNGARLVLFLASPENYEITAFRKGTAEFALTARDRFLVLSYKFTNSARSGNPALRAAAGGGIPWSDAQWEYHRQAQLAEPGTPGAPGTPMPLQLVLVDAATGSIQGIRLVGLSVNFSDALRGALERQKQTPKDIQAAIREIDDLFARHPTSTQLVLNSDVRFQLPRG